MSWKTIQELGCVVLLCSAACSTEPPVEGTNTGTQTQPEQPAGAGSSADGGAAGKPTSTGNTAGAAGSRTNTGGPGTTTPPPAANGGAGGTPSAPTSDAGSGGSGPAATGDVPVGGASAGAAATAGAGGVSEGAAGAAGSAAGEGAAGEAATPQEDLGKGDGSDVITIGDSWMSIATNGGGIEGALNRAGTNYRNYAVAGTQLLNGQIPGQYDQAKRANADIKTIIMTGGGNDVMFSGGCSTKEACTAFSQMIADGLDELWVKAAADGATGAVYIQYSRNAGTAPAETRPDMPAIPKICSTNSDFRCVFINTTDLIGPGDTGDGIHPTLAGCDRIAKRVIEEMEKAGVRR
jgi:hypothetical protein